MTKANQKYNAGIRILEVLNILLNEKLTRKELLAVLKEKTGGNIHTEEVFLKYFRAFEQLGLHLKRKGNSYEFKNAFLKLNLSKEEENALILILNNYKNLHDLAAKSIVGNIAHKLNKYVDLDTEELFEKIVYNNESFSNRNVRNNLIMSFEKMIFDKQYVNIIYKTNDDKEEEITAVLKEISEKKGKYSILCYMPQLHRNRRIFIDKIIEVRQQPAKNSDVDYLNSVVFKVSGRLASSYKLKYSENVIDFSNEHITISNTAEDKDVLLHRLLKYGELCTILKPESMREEFLALTNKILENLEKSKCLK